MKYDAIKKRGEQWVKIRPALQVYNDSGVLTDTVEDAWYLTEISEERAKLQSRDTAHARHIGLDHIHHYMAEEDARLRTTGTLVMNVQLLLHEGELLTEPVSAPGQPLKAFVRARPRANLFAAASRRTAQAEFERARKEYAWAEAGVRASDEAFAAFPQAFTALSEELRVAGHAIEDLHVRPFGGGFHAIYLLHAAKWWVLLMWQRLAANCLDGSMLTVAQFDGRPREPGIWMGPEPAEVARDQYTWGLAAVGQPRWLSLSDEARSYTTVDLAQEILTRLLEHPNDQQR